MALVITPESPMGIELLKWEKPYKYTPFPKMLYRARKRPDGVISVSETNDYLACFMASDGQIRAGVAEAFTATCQRTVNTEAELKIAFDEGWRESPKDALEHTERLERAISDAAAHRNHDDRNMSEAAKAEAAKHDTGMEHVPVIPEARKRRGMPKGGWPKKDQVS